MTSSLRHTSLFLSLIAASLLLGAAATHAAVPEPPPHANAPAGPDTSRFLPRWLHLHGSAGYGWIQGPTLIRQRYEAGQDLQFGLEARMRPSLRLQLDGEYQVLPAVGHATYAFVAFQGIDGEQVLDTLSFDWRGRGWLGATRAELQWRALPHTWLTAGAGRGYLDAGVRASHFRDPFRTLDIEFPGSTGWGWITSVGARYDFDLFGPLLGAELRWSALDRRQDNLSMWSIRIGWQGR